MGYQNHDNDDEYNDNDGKKAWPEVSETRSCGDKMVIHWPSLFGQNLTSAFLSLNDGKQKK